LTGGVGSWSCAKRERLSEAKSQMSIVASERVRMFGVPPGTCDEC